MLERLWTSYNKVLSVNLTEDSYQLVHSSVVGVERKNGYSFKISDILSTYCNQGYIYKDDVEDFLRYTKLEYIRDFFAKTNGKSSFCIKYRRKVHLEEGYEFHWTIMRMVASPDYSDDNQTVIMTIDDINDSFNHGGARLEGVNLVLTENYKSIFHVNLSSDILTAYRLTDSISKDMRSYIYSNPPYEDLIKLYVSARVCAEDQQRFLDMSSVEYLTEKLSANKAFSFDFRIKAEQGANWFRIKFAKINLEDSLKQFAIGIEDITDEKRIEEDYYRVGKKILVVEDSDVNRSILVAILEDEYDVIEAVNGEEAYRLLEANKDEVAVILTDLEMPVMNGYDFISKVRAEHQYNSIPIVVTTANSEIHVEVRCLKIGASDFVSKPYNPEVVRHRVRSLIKLKESTAMLNTLEKDGLTGLYTKEFFYQRVSDIVGQNPDMEYQIICSDIENFKIVNEKYGSNEGDRVLAYLAESFSTNVPGFEIAGRISGDRFAVLRKSNIDIDYDLVIENINHNAPVSNVVVKFGIYQVDRSYTAHGMCDRALLAVETIKGKYGVNFLIYDDKLRMDLLKQQQIIDNMEAALKEEQFQVYYQPKHRIDVDCTGGAEALIRWIHPTYGFMNPGEFIPLFEQNGFITKVDEYVLIQVCKTLDRWSKEGKNIVPISINLSRRDFERENLAESIIETVDSFNIMHEWIHIEITESAFSDNPKKIAEVVNRLHDEDFVIELDDFGSGYSSLTTLSSMNIDIMKLDMSLIRNDKPGEGKNALEFSMQLAKMLDLKTVAEGVETIEQVERIKSLGGDYIQGYFYSKPLPCGQFEEYIEKMGSH